MLSRPTRKPPSLARRRYQSTSDRAPLRLSAVYRCHARWTATSARRSRGTDTLTMSTMCNDVDADERRRLSVVSRADLRRRRSRRAIGAARRRPSARLDELTYQTLSDDRHGLRRVAHAALLPSRQLAPRRSRAGGLLGIAPIGSEQSRGQAGRFAERHLSTSISRSSIVYYIDTFVKTNK